MDKLFDELKEILSPLKNDGMQFGKQQRGTWIFRGQPKKHIDNGNELVPRIGRMKSWEYKLTDEIELYETFKKRLAAFVNVPASDWEFLALAQHHGLPTRLLDWTYNPLTALFFAVQEAKDDPAADGIVYALQIEKPIKNDPLLARPNQSVRSTSAYLDDEPYQVGEIDASLFKNEHSIQYIFINDILAKKGINLNDDSSITPKRLENVFNGLIKMPNLIELLANNKVVNVLCGKANKETIFANKQKMLEIYPLALKKSQKKRYDPPHIAKRITAQEGLFVWFRDPDKCLFKDRPENWVIKFHPIENKKKDILMKRLALLGFSYDRLFADLDGVASTLSWQLMHNNDQEDSK